MANVTWRGDAPPIAQIQDHTFSGTWEAADLVVATINGKSIRVPAGSTVVATVVQNVVAAMADIDAQAFPEFQEVIVSVSPSGGSILRFTAASPGKPFTLTMSTTQGNGAAANGQIIGAATAVQASRGPEHADDPLNYSGGVLPANTDTLVFTDSDNSIRYGLGALSAVTLASLIVNQSFSGDIGLPNYDDDNRYYQYREKYLCISATTVQVGNGEGSGSGRIKLNLGSVATTVNVNNTGMSRDQNYRSLMIKGTNAANVLNVLKGQVDVAPDQGEASTLNTLRVGYITSVESDSDVRTGSSVTISNVVVTGGKCQTHSGTTSMTIYAGDVHINEGIHASIKVSGGRLNWKTTGQVTQLTVSNATVDLSQDLRPKAFATASIIELFRGAILKDPAGVLPVNVKIRDNTGGVEMNLPAGKTYQVS